MTRSARRKIVVATVTASLLALAACTGDTRSGDSTPQRGGTAVVAMEHDPDFDPARIKTVSDWTVGDALYGTLFIAEADGSVSPNYAESYKISDDATIYTITLRPDLTFHDGTPFDAAAVKFNFDRHINPETGSTAAVYFASVASVDVVDDLTVRVTMKHPDVSFLRTVLAGPPSYIASPSAIQEYGDEFGLNPVGAGPFKFVSDELGKVRVERFEDYWQEGRPYLDAVEYQQITESESRFRGVQSGSLQIALNAAPGQLLMAEDDPTVSILHTPGFGAYFVAMNMRKPPFDSVEARQALCRATDAAALNKAVNFDYYTPQPNSPFGATSPYTPNEELAVDVSHDVDAAKKAVEDMGGLEITQSVFQPFSTLGTAISAQWKEAGIIVTNEVVDAAAGQQRLLSGEYEAMIYRAHGDTEPNRNVATLFSSTGFSNVTGIDDQEVDRLITEGREESDPAKRQEIYDQLSERLAELTPVCWLFSNDQPIVTTAKLHGVPPAADGAARLADAYLEQ